jgi:hypothetical protein
MSPFGQSYLSGFVGVAMSLLAAAVALYIAVRLIELILVPLLIILGVAAAVGLVIAWYRYRNRGW